MRRVLVISYFFPPDGGAGTQRAAKFCKYLPAYGWEATVITRDRAAARGQVVPEDAGLLNDIGGQTRLVRVADEGAVSCWAAELPQIDIGYAWLGPALRAAELEFAKRPTEAIIVTMSPFSLAFVGRRLQQATGVPVVYDLRDPWALDGWRLHGTRGRWRRDMAAMREVLSEAAGVIANTPEAALAIAAAVPELAPERIATITNGYDAEDFAAAEPVRPDPRDAPYLRLVHSGTLHSDCLYAYRGVLGWAKWLKHYRPEPVHTAGRTPLYLLRAIAALRAQGHPCGEHIRVELIGGDDPQTRRCVNESGVADCVELCGYVPHAESIGHIRQADALFLPLHGLAAGRRSLIVPGKAYEYLATGRPILACLPAGHARDLAERSGRGFCADPCDAVGIARALARLFEAWRAGRFNNSADTAWLGAYERYHLTGRLATFLRCIAPRGAAAAGAGDSGCGQGACQELPRMTGAGHA